MVIGRILHRLEALRTGASVWLTRHGAELRQAFRVAIGCAVAFAIYHLFSLPQGYWAVFTVVIVMQGSVGGTLSAAFDRMRGTLVGAAVGAVAAGLRSQTPLGLAEALALSVLTTTFVAAVRPAYKVAPVTAVIMLISPTGGHIGPWESAAFRVMEIFIGSAIGVAVSLFVLPSRSSRLAVSRLGGVLDALAVLSEHFAADLRADAPVPDRHAEHAALRAAIGSLESAVAETAHERSTGLETHGLPEAAPRTLWRVRNDLVAVGRGAAALSPPVRPLLSSAAAILLEAEAGLMRRIAVAAARAAAVDRTGRDAALAQFEADLEALRTGGRTQDLSFDAAAPAFALAFALESLHRNLGDLADRVDEMARAQV